MSASLRGFEERRKGGAGHFIGEAELRKNDVRKMADVVRNFPGLQIFCTRTGFNTCEAVATRTPRKGALQGGDCKYTIYIDGLYLSDPDLNKLTVVDFAGIEAYTKDRIPPQFNKSANACGVLLFWTRER